MGRARGRNGLEYESSQECCSVEVFLLLLLLPSSSALSLSSYYTCVLYTLQNNFNEIDCSCCIQGMSIMCSKGQKSRSIHFNILQHSNGNSLGFLNIYTHTHIHSYICVCLMLLLLVCWLISSAHACAQRTKYYCGLSIITIMML